MKRITDEANLEIEGLVEDGIQRLAMNFRLELLLLLG